ncbi:MAG: Fpg/Nei family DNA glycosylase [Nonomuraea sp.]|nr:Fpg/Nei family DNA glycosylase [Nonomuraea sp.]
MPEGHIIHLLARRYDDMFGGEPVAASSPQGKFSDGAALVDGQALEAAEAHGKHLFLGFGPIGWVRIHLGLYGKVSFAPLPVTPPIGQVRLRLAGRRGFADLRGAAACELVTAEEKRAVQDRLGPDPLRRDADPTAGLARVSRSRLPIAALLMDQRIVSGVGNVYRAEVLFRHGVDPYTEGRGISPELWAAIWADLVDLMRVGAEAGRIDTVRPEHTPEAMGRAPRVDDHGGEVYVYRRAGLPCLVCGTDVRTAELVARNLFWCPSCQRP